MTDMARNVVVTGAAGYIGSSLTAHLLAQGYHVTAIDHLMYGGDSLIPFLYHPDFTWIPADVLNTRIIRPKLPENSVIVHLAAISGFPACQNIGRALAHSYNVDAALSVYKLACELHARSFIFPSTYTAFGSQDESKLVSETDPGNPQTLYAETKIEAEKLLLRQVQPCCPLVILRLSDVFGLSPRTRFDLLINQLVWQALNRREISIYQKSYWRSFLHIRDAVRIMQSFIERQPGSLKYNCYNIGYPSGHATKEEIASMICDEIPGTRIIRKDITFGGYRRDIRASFERFTEEFDPPKPYDLRKGIIEIRDSIMNGMIREPERSFHHNARFAIS